MTLKTANQHRNEWFEGVHKCKQDESLFAVMERIVKAEVNNYKQGCIGYEHALFKGPSSGGGGR